MTPECPGPDCRQCNGQECNKCGAGSWDLSVNDCDHDCLERHEGAEVSPSKIREIRLVMQNVNN